jgi:hypothetical protein
MVQKIIDSQGWEIPPLEWLSAGKWDAITEIEIL